MDHITVDIPLPSATRRFAPTEPTGAVGYRGVRRRGPNKFDARIRVGGSLRHLGTFSTAEEASAAYERVATEAETASADGALVVHLGNAGSLQEAASKSLIKLLASEPEDSLRPRLIIQTVWLDPPRSARV